MKKILPHSAKISASNVRAIESIGGRRLMTIQLQAKAVRDFAKELIEGPRGPSLKSVLMASVLIYASIIYGFFAQLQSTLSRRTMALVEQSLEVAAPGGELRVRSVLTELEKRGIVDCSSVGPRLARDPGFRRPRSPHASLVTTGWPGENLRVGGPSSNLSSSPDTSQSLTCAAPRWLLMGEGYELSIPLKLESLHARIRVRNDNFFRTSLLFALLFGLFSMGLIAIAWHLRRARLQRALERCEHSEREAMALRERSRQVRHDVASPISALRAVVASPEIPGGMRDFLLRILSRTEEIFEDLTGLSEPQVLRREVFSVAQVVHELILEKHNPRVLVHGKVRFVEGRKADFARALSNLLNNAIEASNDRFVYVRLREIRQRVIIVIENQGSGFPEKILRDGPRPGLSLGKPGGQGLGLSSAAGVVRLMGGRMRLTNLNRRRGARVMIDLPLATYDGHPKAVGGLLPNLQAMAQDN